MIALCGAVLLASLLGNLHCAGMCGPFVAFVAGIDGQHGARRYAAQSAYHLSRLVAYVAIGAAAGLLGAALDLGAALAGVRDIAAIAAGAMMVLIGGASLLRQLGYATARFDAPVLAHRWLVQGQRFAIRLPPTPRAALIGALTALLPCGWLYAFAITAAGAGSAWGGAVTMAAFWIGTLPALVAIGVGVNRLAGSSKRHIPALTSLAIVVVGLFTVAHRAGVDLRGGVAPQSVAAATEHVAALSAGEMACCKHGD